MNKKASNTALVVAGIAIVLLVAIIFYEIFRTKPVAEESQMPNLITDPNAGLENMLNDIYDMGNEMENEVTDEIEPEPEEPIQTKKPTSSQTTASKEDIALLEEAEKAEKAEIALQKAKDKYGEEEGTYFSVDAIDSQGRYIVSVHELETTIMITSYAIDVDKGTIVEQ